MYQEGLATYEDIWWGFTSRYLSKEEEAATDELAKKEKEETTATEGQK